MHGRLAGLALLIGLTPTAAPARTALPPPVPLALTFDDLPAHGPLPPSATRLSVVKAILQSLKLAKVREVYGFVVGSFGSDDPQSPLVLKAWRNAGYPLGNHTWSHVNLDSVSAEWYMEDFARDDALLALLMQGKHRHNNWQWFRYPYLAEGREPAKRNAIRAGLAEWHYRVAEVTISFDDYAYNEPYVRCLTAHDGAGVARLQTLYRTGAAATFAAAQQRGGGQIVLLHVGAFTAHMLPQLLADYRTAGARFVPLAEATRQINPAPVVSSAYTTPFTELATICPNAG